MNNTVNKTQMRSEAELKEIARNIYEGHIFTTNNKTTNEIQMCFPILLLMNEETLDNIKKDPDKYFVGFEYLSAAGPMSVNGMPMFFSIRFLSKKEWQEVIKHYDNYVKLNKSFMNDKEPILPFGEKIG